MLDSLVVHLEEQGGRELLLFVVSARGRARRRLRGADRGRAAQRLSPRHAPDTVVAVPAIPRR